jgi:hypothetical protein
MGEESEEGKERRRKKIERRHSNDQRDSERTVQDEPSRQRDDRRDLPAT